MIRSEVQRTLVKSPPELWSEVSDPESLARHLGELGDIRITRSEPENLVEWEAEGTTGTVEIKASGWGTRVTLTVARELPDAGQAAPGAAVAIEDVAEEAAAATALVADQPAEPIELDADEPAGGVHHDEPAEAVEPAQDALAEAVPDAASEEEADEIAASAYEIEADAGAVTEPAAPETDTAQPPKPAPATEAARRAAGWPSAAYEPAERPAEPPEELPAWSAEADEVDLEEPVPPVAPEPRPGFFARLFRRRRRTEREMTAVPQLPDAEAEAGETQENAPAPFAAVEAPVAGVQAEDPIGAEPLADEADEEPLDEEPPLGGTRGGAPRGEDPPAAAHEEQPEAPAETLEAEIETPVAATAPADSEAETTGVTSGGDEAESDTAAADLSAELAGGRGDRRRAGRGDAHGRTGSARLGASPPVLAFLRSKWQL